MQLVKVAACVLDEVLARISIRIYELHLKSRGPLRHCLRSILRICSEGPACDTSEHHHTTHS